jgi:hypothetical protein
MKLLKSLEEDLSGSRKDCIDFCFLEKKNDCKESKVTSREPTRTLKKTLPSVEVPNNFFRSFQLNL